MTEKRKTTAALTSIDSGLIVHDRQAVEALNEFCAVIDRDPNYRQIEPCHLQLQLLALTLSHIELFRDRMNRQPGWPATPGEYAYTKMVALPDVRCYKVR